MKYLRKFTDAATANTFLASDDNLSPNVTYVESNKHVLFDIKPGLFIQHVNGKLFTLEDWAAQGFAVSDANGIAVCDANSSFVISKDSLGQRTWGVSQIVNNVLTTTNTNTAKADYDGEDHTREIVRQLDGIVDESGITGAPAAKACAAYRFPNGKPGYLPSYGELMFIYNNMTTINKMLNAIGGTALEWIVGTSTKYIIWSSTQRSETAAWCVSTSYTTNFYADKNQEGYVRPITKL